MVVAVFIPSTAFAKSNVKVTKAKYARGYYYRTVTVTETKWTSEKYVSGQPKKGTYLKKGDSLSYGENGGSVKANLSMSVGYGIGSVGFSIPLGKQGGSGVHAVNLVAKSKGYYKVKAKKQVKTTVIVVQMKSQKANSAWQNLKPYKTTETIRANAWLVKQ